MGVNLSSARRGSICLISSTLLDDDLEQRRDAPFTDPFRSGFPNSRSTHLIHTLKPGQTTSLTLANNFIVDIGVPSILQDNGTSTQTADRTPFAIHS
jgi:hypothetical protein